MSTRFNSFSEFWPHYLAQHRRPLCRLLHFVGTATALSIYAWAFAMRPDGLVWWLLAAPVTGYAFAWTGHFFIEGNKPATFGHPVWSFIADFRMFGCMLTGRLWTGDLSDRLTVAAD